MSNKQVEEGVKIPFKWATKTLEKEKIELPPLAPEANLPAVVKNPKVPENLPNIAPPASTTSTSLVVKEPKASELPALEVKPTTKTSVAPDLKTQTSTPVQTLPRDKTAVAARPDVPVIQQTGTGLKAVPETKVPLRPTTPIRPEPKETIRPEAKEPVRPEAKPKRSRIPPLPLRKAHHEVDYKTLHRIPVKTNTHLAKKNIEYVKEESRKDVEAVPRKGNRKDIEYVGRKDKDALTRQASQKSLSETVKKVVKEKKGVLGDGTTKVYPNVIINPPMNRQDLNVQEGKTLSNIVSAATSGAYRNAKGVAKWNAGMGAIGAVPDAVQKAKDTNDINHPIIDIGKAAVKGAISTVTDPIDKVKAGDYQGAAMDVATTLSPHAWASQFAGQLATRTSFGKALGQEIGKLPGAQTTADYMRKARDYIGLKKMDTGDEPNQETPKEPEPVEPPKPNEDSKPKVVKTERIIPKTPSTPSGPKVVKTTVEK